MPKISNNHQYLLIGDTKVAGSAQNPTAACKLSSTSLMGAYLVISFNRVVNFGMEADRSWRREFRAWTLKHSAWGPRRALVQPCEQPSWRSSLEHMLQKIKDWFLCTVLKCLSSRDYWLCYKVLKLIFGWRRSYRKWKIIFFYVKKQLAFLIQTV